MIKVVSIGIDPAAVGKDDFIVVQWWNSQSTPHPLKDFCVFIREWDKMAIGWSESGLR